MPSSAPHLFRHFIRRPLLLSLFPLLVSLWALDGPVRARTEAMEREWCRERARMTAQLLIGIVRETQDQPIAATPSGTERILVEDASGRVVHDTASGRLQRSTRWYGPKSESEINLGGVERVDLPGGGPAYRCRASWGEGDLAGALVFLRPLGPLEGGLASARFGVVLLWFLWAVSFTLLGMRAQRRIAAEANDLRRRIDALPGPAGEMGETVTPVLGLERAVRDAEERTRAAISRLEEEILEREAVLRGMLEGVIAVDRSSHVILINPSAERLLGISAPAGATLRVAELVPNNAFHTLVEHILQGGASGAVEFDVADGRRRIRALGDALREADGTLRGAVLVMGDVTEVRRLETVRRDFVANVSHELKTPITAIHGYVETLLEEGEDDPELRRRFLAIVAENVLRMHRILEDLLQLSRVESSGEEIDRSLVDLGGVAERTIAEFRREAAAKGMRIDLSIPENLPPLAANEALLERALGNLIDNAVKYGPAQSIVSVRVVDEGTAVRIEVKDAGPGIAAAHLPRLFERFYRVEKGRSRALGGTGLGLAIVRHIALAHGGEVGVDSRPGIGSTFYMRIPRPPPGSIMGSDPPSRL